MSDNAVACSNMSTANPPMPPEELDVFVRGLYYLAKVDGIDPREERLIVEFLRETQAGITFEDLQGSTFDPREAAVVLETSYLRRVFVRAAIALVKADGRFTDAERRAIGEIADAFGMSNAEFGELEQEASRARLE